MTDTLMHDTLYAPNGGFIPEPGGNSDIWLRKRYSSMVCCPESGFRRPGTMYPRCICLTHNGEANSGIGLSIVKKIIEDHGGRIWATSKEGIGTEIHFVLRKYVGREEELRDT